MAALFLSQVTARLGRLDPAKVWDAVLTMAFAAFLISRILLVAGSWRSFLESPLLVLALPSLNDTGLLLTALVMLVYLRWRKLPLLRFLDAMAPCFALIWAFLSLGDIFAGTKAGMPTRFFFAVGASTLGVRNSINGVHPVEAYTLLLALVLCGVFIRALVWSARAHRPAGRVAALAFGLSGAAIFLLDFLRLPDALFVAAMLDGVQWLGLAMIVVGCALWIATPALPAQPSAAAPMERADAL